MQLGASSKERIGELRESSNQTKAAGKNMRVKGGIPDGVMDDPLFDAKKGRVVVKAKVGKGDLYHK